VRTPERASRIAEIEPAKGENCDAESLSLCKESRRARRRLDARWGLGCGLVSEDGIVARQSAWGMLRRTVKVSPPPCASARRWPKPARPACSCSHGWSPPSTSVLKAAKASTSPPSAADLACVVNGKLRPTLMRWPGADAQPERRCWLVGGSAGGRLHLPAACSCGHSQATAVRDCAAARDDFRAGKAGGGCAVDRRWRHREPAETSVSGNCLRPPMPVMSRVTESPGPAKAPGRGFLGAMARPAGVCPAAPHQGGHPRKAENPSCVAPAQASRTANPESAGRLGAHHGNAGRPHPAGDAVGGVVVPILPHRRQGVSERPSKLGHGK